jgi:hypothetical protein
MPMTPEQFDDFAGRMQTAQADLITAQEARDALSGGVEAAQAAMDSAVGNALAKARECDLLAEEFKNAYRDSQLVTPYVVLACPVEGSEDVALDAPVTVTFSKPMNQATITSDSIFLVDEEGDPIGPDQDGNPVLDAAGLVATLAFDDVFDAETAFRIRVTTDVEDTTGSALANEFTQTDAWTTVED